MLRAAAFAMAIAACSATPPPEAAPQLVTNAPPEMSGAARRAFVSLDDGNVYYEIDEAPAGLYVAGVLESGHFVPEGDVLGEGPLATEGVPGWFELVDGAFCSASAGRTPAPPYVEGVMTAEGVFRPSSRRVVY